MTDSVYFQTLSNVQSIIQALDLDGIEDAAIGLRKIPFDDSTPPQKGITISWDDELEYMGTNCRDDIGYKCIVTMCQGTGKGTAASMDRISQWRQSIRRAFNNIRLTAVSATDVNHLICKVLQGKPELPEKYRDNYDVGQLIVIAWFREPRVV